QYDSPLKQLIHAKQADTPDAWKAVWHSRFTDIDPFTRHLAMQGLVRYYFRHGTPDDYRASLEYLHPLATLSENQAGLRTFGLLGLAVAYGELGNQTEANKARQLPDSEAIERLSQTDPELV